MKTDISEMGAVELLSILDSKYECVLRYAIQDDFGIIDIVKSDDCEFTVSWKSCDPIVSIFPIENEDSELDGVLKGVTVDESCMEILTILMQLSKVCLEQSADLDLYFNKVDPNYISELS